jgi:hypothetical protein
MSEVLVCCDIWKWRVMEWIVSTEYEWVFQDIGEPIDLGFEGSLRV